MSDKIDDIKVEITIGEIVDLIGLAATEICPDGIDDEGEDLFMQTFAQVSTLVSAHLAGVRPYNKRALAIAALARELSSKEDTNGISSFN